MGDVQNNIEDEKQARSQVCLRGGAIQHGDGPERVWRGKSLGGESFVCLRMNCAASLQLGGPTSNALA